jgi:hypothetical protein
MIRDTALLLLALAGAAWGGVARAEGVAEAELKAAFVYNFLQLVEWPANANAQSGFVLCTLGESPVNEALAALSTRSAGTQRLSYVPLQANDDMTSCNALFIGAGEVARLPRLLAALRGRPVLTLADFEHAAERGVMIGLVRVESRLVFEVNLEAARLGGLRVSAKLLRLANHVHGG